MPEPIAPGNQWGGAVSPGAEWASQLATWQNAMNNRGLWKSPQLPPDYLDYGIANETPEDEELISKILNALFAQDQGGLDMYRSLLSRKREKPEPQPTPTPTPPPQMANSNPMSTTPAEGAQSERLYRMLMTP